jgi:hypothetical protein
VPYRPLEGLKRWAALLFTSAFSKLDNEFVRKFPSTQKSSCLSFGPFPRVFLPIVGCPCSGFKLNYLFWKKIKFLLEKIDFRNYITSR